MCDAIDYFLTGCPVLSRLSDETDKERTTENIVSEVHEALQQLGIDRFILMGHSISAIYALSYVNQYPDELSAFVGIDTSVPTQPGVESSLPLNSFKFLSRSGLLRVLKKVGLAPYAALPSDAHIVEQMNMISNKNTNNDTTLNEMKHISACMKSKPNVAEQRNKAL